jgi:arabinogalactan endo-1,4-beta-galactosidase
VVANGGSGVVYWAPDWVSTRCKTRWGTGSTWENAAWFDLTHHTALPVFDFLRQDYGTARR